MGWAKHMEDDFEIMYDRLHLKQQDYQAVEISIIQATLVPVSKNRGKTSLPSAGSESCFTDRSIKCKMCGKPFLFTAQAQEEYQAKNWTAPKRCRSCRKTLKAQKNLQPASDDCWRYRAY